MAWTDIYTQFEKIVNRNFGKGSNWERKIEKEIDDLYRSHKGERDWDEAYRRWRQDQNAQDCGTLDAIPASMNIRGRMKIKDELTFIPHKKYWSDQYHRYFLYKGKNQRTGKYIFEDFGDQKFDFDENEARKLKVKDELPVKPYFDPLYKDIRRAIVKEVEKYLGEKKLNNSTGKYDKVVWGVRSLLERTLMRPDSPDFVKAVRSETDRLLKKYNLTKDAEFDIEKYTNDPETTMTRMGKSIVVELSENDERCIYAGSDRKTVPS